MLIEKYIEKKIEKKDMDWVKTRESYGIAGSVVGILCNIVLFIVKLTLGLLSGSISLLADSVNNLSDVGTNIVTLVGFKMSAKPADREHPFGHGRTEYISSFSVSFIILLLGYELFKSSFERILHPVDLKTNFINISIISLTVLVKIWLSFFYKRLSVKIDSHALEAASVDSRNDVLATGTVLISFAAFGLTGLNIDGYIGLLVACFIIYNGFQFIGESMNTLIGVQPDDGLIEKIYDYIQSYDGVISLHDIIVHDYGPVSKMVSAHVEISADYSLVVAHEIVDQIERNIYNDMGISLVVHIDPVEKECATSATIKDGLEKYLLGYGQEVDIHDFRILEDENVVIFDLVFPEKFEGSIENMRTSINLYLKSKYDYDFLLNIRKEKRYI
ncbi:cation diffusion facilitator family transporter [Alkalibacter mobilis]|uniref:cation diffusion facilitator family transporter n=1 Tax=Alkalibacter mobilis TaxID=2787712 RepID=UPI00189D4A5C|nr:cation diffusion facilitator family transporter [Alkalibacter mobilis]MBF7096579.1 cation transporter [Alkalibacter mobilis]